MQWVFWDTANKKIIINITSLDHKSVIFHTKHIRNRLASAVYDIH